MFALRVPTVVLLVLALLAAPTSANPPASSPLRLIPAEADLVLQVHAPVRAVETFTRLEALQQFLTLLPVKEQMNSTSTRRFFQLVAHFEKTLGLKWPELVERLASDGAALGLQFAANNPPLVLVIQGKDEKLLDNFLKAALEVIEGELARQESKQRVQKGDYKGIPVIRIGDLLLARVGAALVLSNNKPAMSRTLHLHLGTETKSLLKHPSLLEASKLLPKSPLVSAWVNMAPAQNSAQGKALYKSPRDDAVLTVLLGGYLDLLGRTPYLCAGLGETPQGFLLTVRAPRGVEGAGGDRFLHIPSLDQPGTRPPLILNDSLYASSFHFDLAALWKHRAELLPRASAESLTQFDKTSGRILGGVRVSTLLESVGANHRFIAVNQKKLPYRREPYVKLPSFALVSHLREPERFGRAMDTLLRTLGLLSTDTYKLELKEESYRGHDIVAYRFRENAQVTEDVNLLRYNFVPCYTRVGDQFILSSSLELCRELIDALLLEQKQPPRAEAVRARELYSFRGLAGFLRGIDDQLVTQTILQQAVPPAEARKQVDDLLHFVGNLGTIRTMVRFGANNFRYDAYIQLRR